MNSSAIKITLWQFTWLAIDETLFHCALVARASLLTTPMALVDPLSHEPFTMMFEELKPRVGFVVNRKQGPDETC